MNFKGEIFLAYRYLRPQKTLLSLLTYTSILGPLLGVAVLIVVMSIMNGMPKAFVEALKNYNPHITLESKEPLPFADDLVNHLEKTYQVHASPVTPLKVFVQHENTINPFMCKGIFPKKDTRYKNVIDRFGVSGELYNTLKGNEVLLSINTAYKNNYQVGDKLILHSPSRYQDSIKSKEEGKIKRINLNAAKEFTIVGFYSVPYQRIDKQLVIIHQDAANEMLSLDWGAAKNIEITLKDPLMAEAMINKLKTDPLLKDFNFIPWMDQNDGIYLRIKQEKLQMQFILFLIMIAAGIGIGACIFSLIVQKTKEIGILKATGVNPFSIVSIILSEGLFIGILGSSLGFAIGWLILKNRFAIVSFLGKFDEGMNTLQTVPMYLDPSDVNRILWGSIGICLASAIIPALIAATINPVKALQGGN